MDIEAKLLCKGIVITNQPFFDYFIIFDNTMSNHQKSRFHIGCGAHVAATEVGHRCFDQMGRMVPINIVTTPDHILSLKGSIRKTC